ncbi:MAG: DUF4831 family protein [Muribaculaceae bacterium]|nr:DUF4831 family protein [Muribaculaceae bacterium]
MKKIGTTVAVSAIAAAVVGLCPVGASAQSSQRLTANKANEYGLIYSLPNTMVDITVVTERTVSTPGEFANYANRHLGIKDAVKQASETVTVKEVILNTRGVGNPDNRWLAQFKNGANVSMFLTDGEVPLGINIAEPAEPGRPELPKAVPAPVSPLETEAARQAVTLDMTRSTSLSKKAELAAQRIFELREQRNDLISGSSENMPADGGALKVALNALDAQENALTAMFAGTRLTQTDVQTFSFMPGDHEVADTVVARVSPVDGVVDINDLTGIPLSVSIKEVAKGKLPVNEKGEEKKFPKGGVAYNIPGTAEISVSYNGRQIGSWTVELAQMGCTFGIEPGLFTDKKAPMSAVFSPVTGALISLEPASGV